MGGGGGAEGGRGWERGAQCRRRGRQGLGRAPRVVSARAHREFRGMRRSGRPPGACQAAPRRRRATPVTTSVGARAHLHGVRWPAGAVACSVGCSRASKHGAGAAGVLAGRGGTRRASARRRHTAAGVRSRRQGYMHVLGSMQRVSAFLMSYSLLAAKKSISAAVVGLAPNHHYVFTNEAH